ncbi:MAG: MBL fold metallo-hydrolase [Clostridiales bacterium]|nr:MBL fold metallo-hydrolase [Clostridiales bacterium]
MKQVRIIYLGHACFCLEAEGYRTVVDPYIDGMVPGLPPLRVSAEAVYCSHGHEDHNFVGAVVIQKTSVPAPYTLEAFVTPHDAEEGRRRGMNTVRIFDFGGLRVAHMGDVGRPLTEEETAKLRGVDCLLIPVGGFYTIDARQARDMAAQIQPRVLIPMHYRTKTTGFGEIAPLEAFTGLYPHVVYGGDCLELTPETPEQVLVLTIKNKEI